MVGSCGFPTEGKRIRRLLCVLTSFALITTAAHWHLVDAIAQEVKSCYQEPPTNPADLVNYYNSQKECLTAAKGALEVGKQALDVLKQVESTKQPRRF